MEIETFPIKYKYPKTEWDIYKLETIKRLEDEIRWLKRELKETCQELADVYSELSKEQERRKFLEKTLIKILKESHIDVSYNIHHSEIEPRYIRDTIDYWEESEKLEKAKMEIKNLKKKIEKGEELHEEELHKLVEIDILSEKYPELKKVVKEIILMLEKIAPKEVIELKEGEIREIDENTIIRKRRDGIVEVIIL